MENYIQKDNITQGELMSLIEQDAEDTKAKLADFADIMVAFVESEGENLGNQFSEVKETIGDGLTWIDGDGNIFNIEVDDQGRIVTTTKDGSFVVLVDEQGNMAQEGLLTDLSGNVHNLEESLENLGGQLQSTEFVRRLAILASREGVSSSDFVSMFSDMQGKFTNDVAGIYQTLLTTLSSFDTTAIAAAVSRLYLMFKNLTANGSDTAIEFVKDEWTVCTYAGTITKGLIKSAGALISSVLFIVGGPVAKIVALAGGAIVWGITSFSGLEVTTEAEFNPAPVHYEFIKPLWQGEIPIGFLPVDIEKDIMKTGVLQRKTPAYNIYLWTTGNKFRYKCEIYANMLCTRDLLDPFESYRGAFYTEYDSALNVVRLKLALDALSYQGTNDNIHPLYRAGSWLTGNYDDITNPAYERLDFGVSQDQIRERVWISALVSYFQIRNLHQNWTHNDNFTIGTAPNTGSGGFNNRIAHAIYQWLEVNEVPDWAFIVNEFWPDMRAMFDGVFGQPEFISWIFGLKEPSFPERIGVSGSIGFNVRFANFRRSFCCIPPTYDRNTVIFGIAGAIAIAAAVTGAVMGVRGFLASRLQGLLTRKSLQAQTYFNEYTDPTSPNYQNKATLRRYIKAARMVTGVSNFANVSTMLPTQMGLLKPNTGAGGGLIASIINTAGEGETNETVTRVEDSIVDNIGDLQPSILTDIYVAITGDQPPEADN